MSEKLDSASATRTELDAAVRQLREELRIAGESTAALHKIEKEVADTKKESAVLRVLLDESEQSLYLFVPLSPLPSPLYFSSFFISFLICYKDGNQERLPRGTKERGGCGEVEGRHERDVCGRSKAPTRKRETNRRER